MLLLNEVQNLFCLLFQSGESPSRMTAKIFFVFYLEFLFLLDGKKAKILKQPTPKLQNSLSVGLNRSFFVYLPYQYDYCSYILWQVYNRKQIRLKKELTSGLQTFIIHFSVEMFNRNLVLIIAFREMFLWKRLCLKWWIYHNRKWQKISWHTVDMTVSSTANKLSEHLHILFSRSVTLGECSWPSDIYLN